eukprot:COSAG02_NODE_594_length_19849_cov_323.373114_13_plen_174_part_00
MGTPRALVTVALVLTARAAGIEVAERTTGGAACSFAPMDCTHDINPPGFMRNWGVDAAAQQRCCQACANNTGCAIAVLATDQGGVCMLKSHGTECKRDVRHRLGCLPAGRPDPPFGPAPSPSPPSAPANNAVPKWKPTFNMSESTLIMPCNYTGLYDYEAYPDLAKFGAQYLS